MAVRYVVLKPMRWWSWPLRIMAIYSAGFIQGFVAQTAFRYRSVIGVGVGMLYLVVLCSFDKYPRTSTVIEDGKKIEL